MLINIAYSYILYILLWRIRSLSILESTRSIANARSPRLALICHHYVALWTVYSRYICVEPSLLSTCISRIITICYWRFDSQYFWRLLTGSIARSSCSLMLREMNIWQVFTKSPRRPIVHGSLLSLHEGAVLRLLGTIVQHAVWGRRLMVQIRAALDRSILCRRGGRVKLDLFFMINHFCRIRNTCPVMMRLKLLNIRMMMNIILVLKIGSRHIISTVVPFRQPIAIGCSRRSAVLHLI